MGFFVPVFWRFPSIREFAGQFPEPVCFSFSSISPRSSVLRKAWEWVVMMRMRFLASKARSLAPVDSFRRDWGEKFGRTHFCWQTQAWRCFHVTLRYLFDREFWLKFSWLGAFLDIFLRPRVRSGRRGTPAFPDMISSGLLDHLNSDGFVLEGYSL